MLTGCPIVLSSLQGAGADLDLSAQNLGRQLVEEGWAQPWLYAVVVVMRGRQGDGNAYRRENELKERKQG